MKMGNEEVKSQVVEGKEAIEFLESFIEEINESELTGLTEQQARVMNKVAQVLISAIEKETTLWKRLKQTDLMPKLKTAMEKLIQKIPIQQNEVEEQVID